MGLLPISAAPGICLTDSPYAAGKDGAVVPAGSAARQAVSRYVDGYNVEFIAGYPQKIAGWSSATTSQTTGIPRAMAQWRIANGDVYTAIGTETHLYALKDTTLTDITPLRTLATGTLSGPLTTTIDSNVVEVADATQVLQDGDWVYLSASAAVGGVTVDGYYPVSGRSGTGYNITVPIAASSSAGPGGGTVTYGYPRVDLTNPFSTTSGSAVVNVNHTGHGAAAGSYVTFSGASSVGGLTINGEYSITSVVDPDNYTITASSTAAATAGPGGGTVSVTYNIDVQQTSYASAVGYGVGAYGMGAYGYGQNRLPVLRNGWSLSAYGYYMLAAPIGGTIYVYNPAAGGRAYPLLNAPVSVNGMFVTPERFVVALGINGNDMELSWCDQNDFTVWTATATNTANDGRTLIGGNFFVGGIPVRNGVSLIFSDKCVFEMTYTGSNEVYNTTQAGDNCGLVSPTAVAAEGGVAYWMSDQDWWMWAGSVQSLPSDDVRAAVYNGGLNPLYLEVCTAAINRTKHQVRFWYPSSTATDNDAGMIYQYDQKCWSPLNFGRTCGIDAELYPQPMSCDADGNIFYDESGADADSAALPFALEFGVVDISNGDRNIDFMGVIPDFKTISGDVSFYALTKYYPQETNTYDGPYVFTSATTRQDLRANGKLFGFKIQGDELGVTFRLGVPRLDIQPAGARN